MSLYPVSLGLARIHATPKKTKTGARKSGSDVFSLSKDIKTKILERDQNTCKCCGFISRKYQEIICLDGNVHNLDESNLATACIFCHQCFNIDQVSIMRSGVLLWLPEIPQTELHHIARAIYVARISQGPVADASRRALDTIMKRREAARARIGTDDPYILAMVLKDYLTDGHYKNRNSKLDGIKLFPLDRRIIKEADLEFNQFPQILAYWRSKEGPFGGRPPQKWFDIYHQIMQAA